MVAVKDTGAWDGRRENVEGVLNPKDHKQSVCVCGGGSSVIRTLGVTLCVGVQSCMCIRVCVQTHGRRTINKSFKYILYKQNLYIHYEKLKHITATITIQCLSKKKKRYLHRGIRA